MRSSNPALGEKSFTRFGPEGYSLERGDVMTIEGTSQKALILLGLAVLTGGWTWSMLYSDNRGLVLPLLIGGIIVSLIASLVAIFNPKSTPVSAPIYAAAEGIFLGAFSAFLNAIYPGIVPQAVGITFGVLGALLLAYQAGIIKATEPFKRGVIAATGAICLVYIVNFVLRMFGVPIPFLHDLGLIGIGISVVICIVAALNFVLDFDFIEEGARQGAPKFMEWYGAFSLMLTLVWLYLEVLRLLWLIRGLTED